MRKGEQEREIERYGDLERGEEDWRGESECGREREGRGRGGESE